MVDIVTAGRTVEALIDNFDPAFVWGPPGVGKSEMIASIPKARGWGFIDWRASLRESVDIRGMPAVDLKAGVARWLPDAQLPNEKRDGKEGILFLDELNAAHPSVQVACFGLVLDRQVGEYKLPDGWRIVAAGNRQLDRAAAQRMPSALANRFAHIEVDVEPLVWIHNYADKYLHPMISAFIRFRPDKLFSMDGADLRAFPTPRSWAKAAKYVDQTKDLRMACIKAHIGEGPMIEFEGFLEICQNLPDIDDILNDPKGEDVPKEPGAKYAIAGALARRAEKSNFKNAITYAQRLGRELEIVMVTDATKRDEELCNTKSYIDFTQRNKDLQLG